MDPEKPEQALEGSKLGVKREPEVGMDSQCLSYLIDAYETIAEPVDAMRGVRLALGRLHFARRGTLWVTPTVEVECSRIRKIDRRDLHRSWIGVLFGVLPVSDPEKVERRARELTLLHADVDDCRVLAEAEDIGLDVLLSHDERFVSRLGGASSSVVLVKPEDYWESLGIAPGTPPLKVPHPTNPLAQQTWWRW